MELGLQYEKNDKGGDRIILLTKKFNEKDTRRGLKEFNIQHVELVIVDVPNALNWFREKHSAFHHMYYILWQHWAWLWVKHSGIRFDEGLFVSKEIADLLLRLSQCLSASIRVSELVRHIPL